MHDNHEEFLVALARALQLAGEPAHRLEARLLLAAKRFGMSLTLFTVPTGVIMTFDSPSGPRTHVIHVAASKVNLESLVRLSELADHIVRGTATLAQARKRLDEVLAAPPRYSRLTTVGAYVCSGGAFSVFFSGGMVEVMMGVVVGLIVGLLNWALSRTREAAHLFELAAAAAAGFVVVAVDRQGASFIEWVPLAAGLIMLLPGMALVDSVEELANGQLVAGAARLAGVGVVFLAVTFGVALGVQLAELLPDLEFAVPEIPLPVWTAVPALVVVAFGSMIRFRAHPQDFVKILAGSTLALVGVRAGTALGGPVAGPFMGAFTLGLAANLYARYFRGTAELLEVPGIALLVPGSVGIRSLEALLQQDTAAGIDEALRMFLIAMALATGLLFSSALVRERVPG